MINGCVLRAQASKKAPRWKKAALSLMRRGFWFGFGFFLPIWKKKLPLVFFFKGFALLSSFFFLSLHSAPHSSNAAMTAQFEGTAAAGASESEARGGAAAAAAASAAGAAAAALRASSEEEGTSSPAASAAAAAAFISRTSSLDAKRPL